MRTLELGGNAVDAACAAGFALQVAEPHLCGPAGEVPILIHSRREKRTVMICGQGGAPANATLAAFEKLGLGLIPGTGLLPAMVPGAFGAWLTALKDYGSLSLAEVLSPTVALAAEGLMLLPRIREQVETLQPLFSKEWPSSAKVWLPGGAAPALNRPFRNPDLAQTYSELIAVEKSHAHLGRERALEAVHEAFYCGFVADAMERFLRVAEVLDVTGRRHQGLLSGQDIAQYRCRVEEPLSIEFAGLTVHKGGFWSQAPVFLQQLRLLEGFDLKAMGHNSPDAIHHMIECAKLAYADREVYYGDPDFAKVPAEVLLSAEYAAERRKLVDPAQASTELRPGSISGYDASLDFLALADVDPALYGIQPGQTTPPLAMSGVGEPVTSGLGEVRGDTVHVDVIDKEGNMVAATPSGGWLQSSPVIPGLGFPLGTRGQMFWLTENHPNGLQPGKRPRTTLTPTMVTNQGEPYMAFGTPGGDTQDQWNLQLFLGHVLFGKTMQEAIEAPGFHSTHFPSSFFPRARVPAGMVVEGQMPPETVEALQRRGHEVTVAEPWSVGRECSASIDTENGVLRAAASPRAMSGYAIGR